MSRLDRGTIRVFDREFDFFGYEDDTWYQSVKSQGVWTEFTLDHLSQLVAPTDICLDIGANVGTRRPLLHIYESGTKHWQYKEQENTDAHGRGMAIHDPRQEDRGSPWKARLWSPGPTHLSELTRSEANGGRWMK
jgi:hypothetical protein